MNMYDGSRLPMCNDGVRPQKTYGNGMQALEGKFVDALRTSIDSGRYSHVFFMAMGWNNDQRVSVCRYREITEQVVAAAAREGETIRPLIVGMTWPSSWNAASTNKIGFALGHIGSIFNKATDSDEAGLLYGNLILNRLIPQANHKGLPVVMMGHSLGTRLGGMALFQRDLLAQGPIGPPPDLAVFLQPAHSVFRYTPDAPGLEGHPFSGVQQSRTRVVITSSEKDTANPFAVWTLYLGGRHGMARAWSYPGSYHRLPVTFSGPEDAPRLGALGTVLGRVNLVDATAFIERHSDILDAQIGTLIAQLLLQHAR